MKYRKEGKGIYYEPTTTEIFHALASMPSWSQLLLEHTSNKEYSSFLGLLIARDFKLKPGQKISVSGLAQVFDIKPDKVKRFISQIYEDIFELNDQKKELFQLDSIKVLLFFKYFEEGSAMYYSLPVIPRKYELFTFPFIAAKLGVNRFWVKRVEYEIENDEMIINIWLQGGFANEYREMLLQRAVFENEISVMEELEDNGHALDNKLLQLYRK